MKKVGLLTWLVTILWWGVALAQWQTVPTPRPTPRPVATKTPTPRPTPSPTSTPISNPTPTPTSTPIPQVGTPTPTPTPTIPPTPLGTPSSLEILFSAFEYSGALEVRNAKAGDIVYLQIISPSGALSVSPSVTLSGPSYTTAVHISGFAPGSTVKIYVNGRVVKQILLPE